MKKIYFTIVLFLIGLFIVTAAFNYHRPFIGNGGIDSIADGIYDFGEVFDIEDKKDNLGFPNAERLVPTNDNDSDQIGGVSDTPDMLAVTGTDGEAGYDSDDIVSREQSVTEDSENSDQTAGDDNTIPPFVWDNSLIPAFEIPPGYRPVGIPFGRNRIGKGIGPSGTAGPSDAAGPSDDAFSPEVPEDEDINDDIADLNDPLSDNIWPSDDAFSPEVPGDEDINDDIADLNDPPPDNIDWERILDEDEDEKNPGEEIEYNYDEVTPHPTPEPATIFLFGSGLIGLGVFGRKKLKRS